MISPLVSVIIPTTKGEEEKVAKCIRFIKGSTYNNIEIIVVDEGKERSAQRNIGIDRSKGSYLLFLDSDQYIHSELIYFCVLLSFHLYGSLYIPEIITTPGFFGYLRNWERRFYTGTAVDCVRFLKKNNCPKFDETLNGPEDSDWDRRVMGLKGISNYPLYHNDGVGFIQYLKKKAYYTKSMKRFKEKNPDDKVLNFWWRCFGVFFEDGKWKRFVKRPDLFICLMGLIFLRGIIYKWPRS